MHSTTPAPVVLEELDLDDADATEIDMGSVFTRPDGYYWQEPGGGKEFGPFATLELALADMGVSAADDEDVEPGETLAEAEDELGIADWIDPDTGSLAEGLSTPHLNPD
jgi:hypothetical protein